MVFRRIWDGVNAQGEHDPWNVLNDNVSCSRPKSPRRITSVVVDFKLVAARVAERKAGVDASPSKVVHYFRIAPKESTVATLRERYLRCCCLFDRRPSMGVTTRG